MAEIEVWANRDDDLTGIEVMGASRRHYTMTGETEAEARQALGALALKLGANAVLELIHEIGGETEGERFRLVHRLTGRPAVVAGQGLSGGAGAASAFLARCRMQELAGDRARKQGRIIAAVVFGLAVLGSVLVLMGR